ncbi:endonuclease [bacterium endosymbiont of Pedicinus badii]|uniref:endonuclease n=1 Tax=bacterium endosymbiont of Pedicinus badii TaxID=1719126 RepID=UPI0009BA5409|nr:endonuclease [bacterium endosymbiont of Pedicinus badii]OQM34019.1 hypothetical protein AOQ89_01505 [bacterium endosymbiont of Pedicinus badii]
MKHTKKIKKIILLFSLFYSFSIFSKNFLITKKIAKSIHYENPKTFYCSCKIIYQNSNKLIPDLSSCSYKIRKNKVRANRIEWEHIVPVSVIKEKYCRKEKKEICSKNKKFQQAKNDLHNLQPVIGEINGDRRNYRYGELENYTDFQYGSCKIKIDFHKKIIEPFQESKGIVARTYMYMNSMYEIKISDEDMEIYRNWNNLYPAKDWECLRNIKIYKVQGRINKYISESCKKNKNKINFIKPWIQ